MSEYKKTDNKFLEHKIELRRYFITKYHADGSAKVLDCCQGDGVLWNRLQTEFAIASYWGVDKKRKKGRLMIDSVKVVQRDLIQDIIDVDTYGSPWRHYKAILENMNHSVTIFLTIGHVGIAGHGDQSFMELIGCTLKSMRPSFRGKISEKCVEMALGSCYNYGYRIDDAREAFPQSNARYIGIRLERL